jgi:hypothetical protein
MRTIRFLRPAGWMGIALMGASCSTYHFRKFDEGDLGKEIPVDVAKRFEVKELPSAPAAAPSPHPAPLVAGKITRKPKKSHPPEAQKMQPPLRRMDPMPFDVGEKLSYDLRFLGVTAATFDTEVQPFKEVSGRKVYQLHARAKTVKLFELVYRADDRINSFWDYESLYSLRFSMDLDESKQSRKVIELYDYEKNRSFYWNRIDHVEKGFIEQKENHDIKPWSQDALSSLFYLRAAPLPLEAGKDFRMSIVVDGKPWDTVVRYLRTEHVFAAGAKREARVYHLENYQNGELKNRENTLWLSTDAHRYILRLETKLKVGKFAVALDKIL